MKSFTRRTLAAPVLLLALMPALAACGERAQTDASATPTASSTSTAMPEPTTSATGAPDSEPSSTPVATETTASDDDFCELMQTALDAQVAAAEELQGGIRSLASAEAIAAGDVSALNATGDTIVQFGTTAGNAYADGAAIVGDNAAESMLTAMADFESLFVVPVGEVFASATSFEAAADIAAISSDAEVQAAMQAATDVAPDLAAYIGDRCDISVSESALSPASGLG